VLGMQVRAMANCAVQHPARCPAVGTCDRWHPAPSICVPRHRIQRAILTPKPVIRFVRQHQGHDRQGWWQGSYQISRSTVRPTLGRPLGVSGFFTFLDLWLNAGPFHQRWKQSADHGRDSQKTRLIDRKAVSRPQPILHPTTS
jgi:hypothetical protein